MIGRVTTASDCSTTVYEHVCRLPRFWCLSPVRETNPVFRCDGPLCVECLQGPASPLVVLRGTTKDAERASKARSKHSTHSGHSMIKPVANSAASNFGLSYNANNSPKTRAFVKRDCASETGKSEIANPALLACVSVGVVLHAQKPVCDLICIP